MRQLLENIWWRKASPPPWLRPLAALYGLIADALGARRRARAERLPVPVIMVGNIVVGGSGKTPVTLALIELLRDLGYTPGVLSRGYGGMGPFPLLVDGSTSPELAGDEPALIAARSLAPVCVAPSRVEAGRALLREHPRVNVLICDDGLQHYALARDLEFAVVDGRRGHGNGWRLPAGPLRELPPRLAHCALVLVNGAHAEPFGDNALRFDLVPGDAYPLHGGAPRPLADFANARTHALAGIGNPQRFFDLLTAYGIKGSKRALADHHDYREDDVRFADGAAVLMTEKDAVKCRALDAPNLWAVPVSVQWSSNGETRVRESLSAALKAWRPNPST